MQLLFLPAAQAVARGAAPNGTECRGKARTRLL